MNLCSGTRQRSHDEVCYECRYCPVCAALDEAEGKIKALEKELPLPPPPRPPWGGPKGV
jgi:hypothetical protein